MWLTRMKSLKRFLKVQWSLIAGVLGGITLGVMFNLQWWVPLFLLCLVALVFLAIGMYRFNVKFASDKARYQSIIDEANRQTESYAVSE